MWGDFYYDKKSKRILTPKNPEHSNMKPIFVEFILDNIWSVYNSVLENNNFESSKKLVDILKIKINDRELKSKNRKQLLQTIFKQWLPIHECILYSIVEIISSPCIAQQRFSSMFENSLSNTKNELLEVVQKCNKEGPVVAYISKTSIVERKYIIKSTNATKYNEDNIKSTSDQKESLLVGFARIYSGTIKKGQKLYLFGPKHKINSTTKHRFEITVEDLFILMGQEMHSVNTIPAGNIFAICGLEKFVSKHATLSSSKECPNLGYKSHFSVPVLKVALEPIYPSQMQNLIQGLSMLECSDPIAEVTLNNSGEYVLHTAGELHLERCLTDLRERYAKIDIQVSDPIVSFRETLIYENENKENKDLSFTNNVGDVTINVLDGSLLINIKIIPLPRNVSEFLQEHALTIKSTFKNLISLNNDSVYTDQTDEPMNDIDPCVMSYQDFVIQLKQKFGSKNKNWIDMMSKIWSFGPNRVGPNLLINNIKESKRRFYELEESTINYYFEHEDIQIPFRQIEDNIHNAFQLFSKNGPLCSEPIYGICCIVESITSKKYSMVTIKNNTNLDFEKNNHLMGHLMSSFRDGCKAGFLKWPQRLMLATYECSITTNIDSLGKVYGVVSQRRGVVHSEEVKEGLSLYLIKCHIPVIESFKFGEELHKRTSGMAHPQLCYIGFKILDIDPNWIPSTDEEIEEFGDNIERANLAKKYINIVRKRKGMFVEQKIVSNAEKQRTLKR